MPTIQDVAKKAGVSTATVSRMINDNACVSAKTRDRIQAVIDETGYSPNRRSRNNSNNASVRLKNDNATLIWTADQELQQTNSGRYMMQGLTEGLRSIGATLNVDYIDRSDYIPRSLTNATTGGIFIHGPGPNEALQSYLGKLPVVWLMQQGPKVFGDRVQPNHVYAGQIACQYLIDQGCKNLCCITADSKAGANEFSISRSNGFVKQANATDMPTQVLKHKALNPAENSPTNQAAMAAKVVENFAKLKSRPDGLFVATNLGPYVHMELTKRGLTPMKDFLMIAGDKSICAQFPLDPEPVTIRIFSKEIGRQAFEILMLRLKSPNMPQLTCMLKPQLEIPA